MMFKLYFSSMPTIISTVLILSFALFFSLVIVKRNHIDHWGILVISIFFLGLLMSIISGLKDQINTASALFPKEHWAMILLSILGAVAFAIGLALIIIRKQSFWQLGFYLLSVIIIIKTVFVEIYRLTIYFRG